VRKRRKRNLRPVQPIPLARCDLCARAVPKREAVRGCVPDSSCAHAYNPWFDGLRRITACCDAHREVIRQRCLRRPYVLEELWAAKIALALTDGAPVLSMEQLGCRTGLHEPEIRRAVAWRNAHGPWRPDA